MDIEMLKDSKILGYVERFLAEGEHAEICPIAYKEKNTFILFNDEEKKLFTPYGKFFLPSIKYRENLLTLKEYDLIEFSFIKSGNEWGDDYLVSYAELKNNLPRLHYPHSPLDTINEDYFSLEELQDTDCSEIKKIDSSFYLCFQKDNNKVWVYGKFKIEGEKIRPSYGKEVDKYCFDREVLNSISIRTPDLHQYLLEDLSEYCECENSIDCMTKKQLGEWFKSEFKKQSKFSNENIKICEDIIETFSDVVGYPNEVRFNRIKAKIDNLSWTEVEIKELLKSNSSILSDLLEQHEKFKNEFINEYTVNLDEINKEKEKERHEIEIATENLESRIEDKNLELSDIDETIKTKSAELKSLEENYDTILTGLKVALPIFSDWSGMTKPLLTIPDAKTIEKPIYESFAKKGNTFKTLDDDTGIGFDGLFKENIDSIGIHELNPQYFKEAQALFIPDISLAYIFAKGIQNSKIFVMHVEHDWLHYSDFCNHGLITFWKDCWNDLSCNYILVLDSINLTQPECGLKPLLDVINNSRPTLAETDLGFPDNLKVFATCLSQENKIGLLLSPELFENWGALDFDTKKISLPKSFFNNDSSIGYFEPEDINGEVDSTTKTNWEENKKKYYEY